MWVCCAWITWPVVAVVAWPCQVLRTRAWSPARAMMTVWSVPYRATSTPRDRSPIAGRGDHPDRPGADTLQALADVFRVDVDQLRAAAGLPGAGQPFDLGADAARLTGPQREAIRTTVRLFVEQNDALADRTVRDGATTRHLSAVPGTLSRDEREELYRSAEQIDLESEPYAAADPKDPGEGRDPL